MTDSNTSKSFLPHEVWFIGLLVCSWFYLVIRIGMFAELTWIYTLLLVANGIVIQQCQLSPTLLCWRLRLAFYAFAMPLLVIVMQHSLPFINRWPASTLSLLTEKALFTQLLSLQFQTWHQSWMTQACCFLVFAFFAWLYYLIFESLSHDLAQAKRFLTGLYLTTTICFFFWIILPTQLPLTTIVMSIQPSSDFMFEPKTCAISYYLALALQSFPSLIIALASFIMINDYQHHRTRYYLTLLPYLALLFACLYLGLSYAFDILGAWLVAIIVSIVNARHFLRDS